MASLFVIQGRDQGRHFVLSDGTHGLGRDPSNQIQLLDSEVSRNHAEIVSSDGFHFELSDLNSSNGSMLNGQLVTRTPLANGDRVQIGQTVMIFTSGGQPSSPMQVHGVDIVQQEAGFDASRIISSVPYTSERSTPSQSTEDRSLEVMYRTAIAVGRTNDIPELLERVLRLVFDWVEADRGCIMLCDKENPDLHPAARCDRKGQSAAERMTISRTILDYVIGRKEGVRTSDALDDQRWSGAQSIVQAGIREAICVPLQGRYAILGALYVDTYTSPGSYLTGSHVERFNDAQLRLMIAIGYQAALAIEDTYHYSALVQSERLAVMGQTIANLSHHIKNILQGIRGGSYLIDAGLGRDDQDAVRRGWAMVEKNQEKINDLVMDMLSFSKERKPEAIMTDLNVVAEDVVELMLSRAEEAACQLTFHRTPGLAKALCDPESLHRATLNIVTNAIDAAGEVNDEQVVRPGIVEVRTGRTNDQGWFIDVTDNGPGIPVELREKIFSPFESGKGNRGTGLGLSVSRKIMHEHGGEIEIFDAASVGTTFRLSLPHNPDPSPDDSSVVSHERLL